MQPDRRSHRRPQVQRRQDGPREERRTICDPIALTAASTGLSLVQGKKTYERQLDAAHQVEKAATTNALRQYGAIQDRQLQEQAKASQAIQESTRAARGAASTAAVASAEAGVGGNSVAALQDEFARTALDFESTTIRNQTFLEQHFQDQAEGVRAEQEAVVTNAYNQIATPNYLGLLLKGAGAFLSLGAAQSGSDPIASNTAALFPDLD